MDPKERILRLQEMMDDNPEDSFLTFALAKEWEKKGETENALALYCRLQDRDPDYVGTYYHHGKLQEAVGNAPEAILIYTKGIEIARKVGDVHSLQELAGARMNLTDDEEE